MMAGALLASAVGCAPAARFRAVADEARAAEAPPVLRQAFVLQESYRARTGRWAGTLTELAEEGWEIPGGLGQYHPPRIVRAEGDALCMEMLPLREDPWPHHVDQSGQVRPGRCP